MYSAIVAFCWFWQESLGLLIYPSKPRTYPLSIAPKMFFRTTTKNAFPCGP